MKLRVTLFALFLSYLVYAHSLNDTIYTTTEDSLVTIVLPGDRVHCFSSVPGTLCKQVYQDNRLLLYYHHRHIKGTHTIYIINPSLSPYPTHIVNVVVRSKTWWIWMIFTILGGLGLFLFGIHYMSDGFVRLLGHKLSAIVQQLSRSSPESILAGTLLTTFLQSSSASSIFLMQLVHNRLSTFKQTVGIIIGGALGTTITLQIIALRINNYALFLIAIGFILTFLFNQAKIKNIGQIVTGLGLLYLGLLIMTDGALQIKTIDSVMHFLTSLSNPLAGIIIGIVFTTLTQSASAFIGILMTLGSIGALSLDTSVSLLIGSNIGTSFPVIMDSFNKQAEARNVAWFHLFYRIIVALFFIFWISEFARIVESLSVWFNGGSSVSMPHLIANAHTFMYVSITLLFMPFISLLYRYFSRIIAVSEQVDPYKPKYITDESLDTPNIAIVLAKKETLHLANIVVSMVEQLLPAFLNKDTKRIEKIEQAEKMVNVLRDHITRFLIELNKRNQHLETAKEIYKLLSIVKELEEIADIVDTNLIPKAHFWATSVINFSDEGKQELERFHQHCLKHLLSVIQAMAAFDIKKAKKLKKNEKQTILLAYQLEKSHYTRLMSEVEATVQSSKTHIELIGLLQAITRHATQIVRILYEFD
ncbi:MAG: Na/Pi cotransporter family protein [Bacteroidales bacterium]|nr:Na/Pi cotransporter family protein [Bacteroidales bacterium]